MDQQLNQLSNQEINSNKINHSCDCGNVCNCGDTCSCGVTKNKESQELDLSHDQTNHVVQMVRTISQDSDLEKHDISIQQVTFEKPSFDNIDPRNLPFKFGFRCAMSTAGQVIQGLSHTSRYLGGIGEYENNRKPILNKFQEFLYPKISELAQTIVNSFVEKFIEKIDDPLTREVYGANLNGSANNGQLPNSITCIGVSRNVRYEYIQFKNAVALLNYRLNFIAKRDTNSIKRYKENNEEKTRFESLKIKAREFCDYLESDIFIKWEEIKTEARKFNVDVSIKKETSIQNTSEQNKSNQDQSNENSQLSQKEVQKSKLTKKSYKNNNDNNNKVNNDNQKQLTKIITQSVITTATTENKSGLKRSHSSGEGWHIVESKKNDNHEKNNKFNKFNKASNTVESTPNSASNTYNKGNKYNKRSNNTSQFGQANTFKRNSGKQSINKNN